MMMPDGADRRRFLKQIRAIGYPAVEIWERPADFSRLLADCRQADLRLISMIGHQSIEQGINDPGQHNRIEEELALSIQIAADNGIPNLVCFTGSRLAGFSRSQAIDNGAACLRRVAPFAETRGVTLNLEMLNSKRDHPGHQGDHTLFGLELVRKVGSPAVRLLYDIYHMGVMEGDIIHTVTHCIDAIGHIHTAGVPGRHEIDGSQELNYAAIVDAIAASPYDRYVGHEFRPTGEAVAALQAAFTLCDR